MSIKYQIELQRHNVTPRQFYAYCKREFLRRCPGVSLETWMDDYDTFCKPYMESNSRYHHEDGTYEICKCKPYDWQLFLSGRYNFIMEFNFDDEKTGWGYLFCFENE